MSIEDRGSFSAASSALGYLYQCRYAMLEALRRLPDGNQFCLYIETLDDVVFENEGDAPDLLQTKHHISDMANLTDGSTDMWKSIRVWIESTSSGNIPAEARYFLITTATCGEGTAAYYLRPGVSRDIPKALERLNATASTSTNQSNQSSYNAFQGLNDDSKSRLLKSVAVLDSSPQVDDLGAEIRRAVYYAVERKFLEQFLQRLEGWWLSRVIKHLKDTDASPILSEEVEAERNRLREQFKEDSLPIDDEIMGASIDASGYQDHVFVHQLRMIGVGDGRVVHAIRNYFRAFEQRSRWVREDLLLVGELDRYEERLMEEWDLLFEQMRDELGEAAAEEAKVQKAQSLYRWVESGGHHPIRAGVTEPAIARGTYQILSDDQRVGWHVEFREHLQKLLKGTETIL